MEEKAILGVPWTLLSFGANRVLSTLTTVVLAHLLVPADFGIIAITQIVLNFLFWFGGLSFASTLVVRQDLDERGLQTAFSLMLFSGLAVTVVAIAVSPAVAAVFANPKVTLVLIVLSSNFVLAAVTSFYDAMLQRHLEFRRRFAALMLGTISSTVIAVVLALAGASYWSLVIADVASTVVYAIALVVLAPIRVRPGMDRGQVGGLIRTGRGFLAQGALGFIRQNADNVTVGRAFGSTALAFYSMAYRLGDLSYWAIADPVARVTFPAFARSRARGEDIRPAFLDVLRLVTLVGCPVGILLSAAAGPFTRTVLGPNWGPMIGALTVLGIWSALRPIDSTLFWLLNSVGRADLVASLSVAILLPLVPGFIIAVTVGHLVAVAIVVVADTAVSVVALAVFVSRYAGIAVSSLWHAVRPMVLASVPAWVAAHLVGIGLGGAGSLPALIGAVAAGLASYGLVVGLVDRSVIGLAHRSLRRVLNRSPAPAPSS